VAAEAVDNNSFIAKSRASIEALKSANLLKSLNINALIVGEYGVGKETLAKFILPNAIVVDGSEIKELLNYVSTLDVIIIKNFENIDNYQKISLALKAHNTRIIATSLKDISEKVYDEFFSLKIIIPPLNQREEDIEPLVKKFFKEVSEIFGVKQIDDTFLKNLRVDIGNNSFSLRKSVYLRYLMETLDEVAVMDIMEGFLSKVIGGKNDYREQLYLFDVPLIRAGSKKFNSQLSMSKNFGLNRNTLRKKINDYKNKYTLGLIK
jgi:DNA-binding NtrC family response regulator